MGNILWHMICYLNLITENFIGELIMRTIILALLTLVMTASGALAITVNVDGTIVTNSVPINSAASYEFINSSNGSSDTGINHINIVDYILSGRLGAGDHTYTLVNGTKNLTPTDTWFANGAVSVIINEIAGYASTNTFGYYLMNGTRQQLFAGSDNSTTPQHSFSLASPSEFGFYLGVPNTGNTYYTEASRNLADEIHAAIFQVDQSNTYILGFEDLRLCSSDKDYQDMIVSVTINSAPVPEPGTMVLLGFGMLVLAVYGKRRMNKEA